MIFSILLLFFGCIVPGKTLTETQPSDQQPRKEEKLFVKPVVTKKSCKPNVENNSIVFEYHDVNGVTTYITFLVWDGSSAVCNHTINASSANYVCLLPEGKKLTENIYSCEIRAG